eukprot:TRINITY_DN6327_c0_g1_i2.p1 TRINITY_DN6327_c0_g1~~TRINITY_DN6327_c0_g1_i2.p1  ORF type:complete len:132 (+),score=15.24 TRINITY_DN6327_c0_g1_i2:925-1320(+)
MIPVSTTFLLLHYAKSEEAPPALIENVPQGQRHPPEQDVLISRIQTLLVENEKISLRNFASLNKKCFEDFPLGDSPGDRNGGVHISKALHALVRQIPDISWEKAMDGEKKDIVYSLKTSTSSNSKKTFTVP